MAFNTVSCKHDLSSLGFRRKRRYDNTALHRGLVPDHVTPSEDKRDGQENTPNNNSELL
jgi:hypothetical protein